MFASLPPGSRLVRHRDRTRVLCAITWAKRLEVTHRPVYYLLKWGLMGGVAYLLIF